MYLYMVLYIYYFNWKYILYSILYLWYIFLYKIEEKKKKKVKM